jgi:seryl-tRNA synthetase
MGKLEEDIKWYKENAEYYRSADATSNSYKPKIKSQANKIDSLKKELEEKTKEFENISAQNQVIIDEINKEKELKGTIEKFLEDFE